MPYIKKENREKLKNFYINIPENIGELNYILTEVCLDWIRHRHGNKITYSTINEIVGVLECVKVEFYRRVAAIYEDKKRDENGDVYK
jgi:hypothetical protein